MIMEIDLSKRDKFDYLIKINPSAVKTAVIIGR